MTIPDYMISRIIAEEHQHRQFREAENPDLPAPKPRMLRQGGPLTILRNLSEALHTIARHIAPETPAYR